MTVRCAARDEFQVAASDVVVPGGHVGADLIRHVRLATGHLGVPEAIGPRVVDLLRRRRNNGCQSEIICH